MPSERPLPRAPRREVARPSGRRHPSAVVLELQRDRVALRLLAQPSDDFLEFVLALAADPDRVALDLALNFREVVAQHLADLLGQVFGQTPLQTDALADGVAAG